MTRRMIKVMGPVLLALPILLVQPDYAAAQSAGCFASLKECYIRAARQRSWVDRWLSGLDCELDFVECTRRKILGR